MFFFHNKVESGANRTLPLGSVLASTVADWDATISDSYSGTGQTWANIETTPADGSSQTDYDLYRGATSGASTDDPTFNGTAGNEAAYWSFDGGDAFKKQAANTAFLSNLHKTTGGQDYWFAMWLKTPSSDPTQVFSRLFDTFNGTNHGCTLFLVHSNGTNTANLRFLQRGTSVVQQDSTGTVGRDTDVLVGVSYRHDTDTLRMWCGSDTAEEYSFSPSASSTNASQTLVLGAHALFSTHFWEGDQHMYGAAFGNTFIGNIAWATIKSHLETRLGRSLS